MATIRVNIWDQNADTRRQVFANEKLEVGLFVRQLVNDLGYPQTDESNLRLTYRLGRKDTGQILNESQTLEEAGVTENDDLILLPEPTAGWGRR